MWVLKNCCNLPVVLSSCNTCSTAVDWFTAPSAVSSTTCATNPRDSVRKYSVAHDIALGQGRARVPDTVSSVCLTSTLAVQNSSLSCFVVRDQHRDDLTVYVCLRVHHTQGSKYTSNPVFDTKERCRRGVLLFSHFGSIEHHRRLYLFWNGLGRNRPQGILHPVHGYMLVDTLFTKQIAFHNYFR